MNPLMDALKETEDARPALAVRDAGHDLDEPSVPISPRGWLLDPIHATRDDADAGAVPPAAQDVDEPPGPAASRRWLLDPIRATRDDADSEMTALDLGLARPESASPAGPARAMVDDVEATGHRPRRASLDRPDTSAPRATTPQAFDPRTLPPRRGVGRAIGVTLSFLSVIGIGAGGGYYFWKTYLVRPALVRLLPLTSATVLDLTPMHTASAAPSVAGESGAGVAIQPEARPRVPAPESPEESRAAAVAGPPVSDGPEEPPAASVTGISASEGLEELRATSAASVPSLHGPAEPRPALPLVEPIIRAAADSPAGFAGHPEFAMERAGTEPRPGPGAGIVIRKRVRADHVAASLERAYDAFRAGDVVSAAEAYRAVLGHEPHNRDALIGLAAVAAQAGRWDEAAGHYARVLALHPADTVAQAALIAIDEQDPARGESRLKALLWSEPRAAHLHFNLGNVYAAQSRWPEAQQSYFDAHRFDNGNADYAYNLAVSLDHLSRRESALDFYREALALAQSRPASFDTAAVLARIRDINPPQDVGFAPARSPSEPDGAAPIVSVR